MTWIRRADPATEHHCQPPERPWAAWINVPTGHHGDLWQCDTCHKLWRVATACDWCDRYGDRPHGGQHAVFDQWRPARLRDELRHRRR